MLRFSYLLLVHILRLRLMKYLHQVHRNVTLAGTPTTMAGDKCTETKTENVENLNILVVDC